MGTWLAESRKSTARWNLGCLHPKRQKSYWLRTEGVTFLNTNFRLQTTTSHGAHRQAPKNLPWIQTGYGEEESVRWVPRTLLKPSHQQRWHALVPVSAVNPMHKSLRARLTKTVCTRQHRSLRSKVNHNSKCVSSFYFRGSPHSVCLQSQLISVKVAGAKGEAQRHLVSTQGRAGAAAELLARSNQGVPSSGGLKDIS